MINYEDIYTAEYQSKRDINFFSQMLIANNSARVLEVGCGTGRIYEGVKSLEADIGYTGIDYSVGALAYLKTNHPDAETLSGVFPQCLPSSLVNGFDAVIFAFNGLSYIPEQSRSEFFSGCSQVLRAKGKLFLHFFRFDPTRLEKVPEEEKLARELDVNGLVVKKYISSQRILDEAAGAVRRTFVYRFVSDGEETQIKKDFDVYPCRPEVIMEQLKAAGFNKIQKYSDPINLTYDPDSDDLYLEIGFD